MFNFVKVFMPAKQKQLADPTAPLNPFICLFTYKIAAGFPAACYMRYAYTMYTTASAAPPASTTSTVIQSVVDTVSTSPITTLSDL